MANIQELYATFESFAAFGSSRNLATGSTTDLSGPTLDGPKFAKFARDAGLLGKSVTTTDIDIIFNQVKSKNARRIDFEQFQAALRLIAEKRYGKTKRSNEAYSDLVSQIIESGSRPLAKATTTSQSNITARMTDHTMYTGTHKNRFDDQGKGMGGAGRDTMAKTSQLSQLTNREEANIRGVNVSIANAPNTSTKRTHQNIVTASSERLDVQTTQAKKSVSYQAKTTEPRPIESINKNTGVFDRLTDTSGYTGSHKQRFNSNGTGRGLAGRDTASKGGNVPTYRGGDVKDLSQILRN